MSVMLVTSVWMACPVRVFVSCRLTFASMTASVTSSQAREPSAGGWGLEEMICLCCQECECVGLQGWYYVSEHLTAFFLQIHLMKRPNHFFLL